MLSKLHDILFFVAHLNQLTTGLHYLQYPTARKYSITTVIYDATFIQYLYLNYSLSKNQALIS